MSDNARDWKFTLGGALALGLLSYFTAVTMPPERRDVDPTLFVTFATTMGGGLGLSMARMGNKPKP